MRRRCMRLTRNSLAKVSGLSTVLCARWVRRSNRKAMRATAIWMRTAFSEVPKNRAIFNVCLTQRRTARSPSVVCRDRQSVAHWRRALPTRRNRNSPGQRHRWRGLDWHLLGRRDVVQLGRADRGIDRAIRIRIIDHMHLGAADAGREPRPTGAVCVQPHAGRVNQIHGVRQLAAQPAMRASHQTRQQFGEHRARSQRIRIRQGRAPNRIRTQMAEPCRMARQACHDLAQARRARKLAIRQCDELALGGQAANSCVGTVPVHRTVELVPGNVLQHRMKYAILMPYGADPPLVPRNACTRPEPR